METPLYVVKALAEVREGGEVNMMDRRGVAALSPSAKAEAWINKSTSAEYMEALNDMGAYISGDMTEGIEHPSGDDFEDEDEGDGIGGNYTY